MKCDPNDHRIVLAVDGTVFCKNCPQKWSPEQPSTERKECDHKRRKDVAGEPCEECLDCKAWIFAETQPKPEQPKEKPDLNDGEWQKAPRRQEEFYGKGYSDLRKDLNDLYTAVKDATRMLKSEECNCGCHSYFQPLTCQHCCGWGKRYEGDTQVTCGACDGTGRPIHWHPPESRP